MAKPVSWLSACTPPACATTEVWAEALQMGTATAGFRCAKLALAAALRSIVLRPEEPSEQQQQQASSVVALAGAGGH